MSDLLSNLSGLSTLVIASACAVHLFVFFVLAIWARRDLRRIVSSLDDFTRGLSHRSVLGATGHLTDQVDAFIADVNDVLHDRDRNADRQALLQRMRILDERRGYLGSMFFETSYNMSRTMIEAYPLAGVLGTILAIGAALQTGATTAAQSTVGLIVERFGDAIWSTFAGLVAAIVLMFINSLLEPTFHRLAQNRSHVRDMVSGVKRELSLGSHPVEDA